MQFTRVEAFVRWSWIRRVFPAPFNLVFPICNSLYTVRDHSHFTPSHPLGHRHPWVQLELAKIEGDDYSHCRFNSCAEDFSPERTKCGVIAICCLATLKCLLH